MGAFWRGVCLVGMCAVLQACLAHAPGVHGVNRQGIWRARSLSLVQAEFNDAYRLRADENEQVAKESVRNPDKALLRLIHGARSSLDGAFFDIKDVGVVDALLAAKRRGVRVRLVTETDNLGDRQRALTPGMVLQKLVAAGVPIVDDQRPGFMHHKFLVADNAQVWTGSANLTTSSLYQHNNNALTITDGRVASRFTQEFERLFLKRRFDRTQVEAAVEPDTTTVGDAELTVRFSPHGATRELVLQALRQARRKIDVLAFALSDPEIAAILLEKSRQGIPVNGVFDGFWAHTPASLFGLLVRASLNVVADGNEALMHHKVLIIDSSTVITGSYNFSSQAAQENNEAVLMIRECPRLIQEYEQEFARVYTVATRQSPGIPPSVSP